MKILVRINGFKRTIMQRQIAMMRVLALVFLLNMHQFSLFAQLLITDSGVKPNNIEDQSAKINKMIMDNPGKTIRFPKGVYQVGKITIKNNITLSGENAVIRGSRKGTGPILEIIGGHVTIKNITVDGNYDRALGIYILTGPDPSRVIIENCLISNIHGNSAAPGYGIQIRRNLLEVRLINTRISDVDGPENGIQGDTYGANRGIYINNINKVLISGCTITDVKGYEDGDCIQFLTWKETLYPRFIGQLTIENNLFENIYKRGLKIMAKNTIIRNNQFYDLRHDPGMSYAAISIYADNNLVENNLIDFYKTDSGLDIQNCKDNMILSNNIKVEEFRYQNKWSDLWSPIKITDTDGLRIQDNTFKGKVNPGSIILRLGKNIHVSDTNN